MKRNLKKNQRHTYINEGKNLLLLLVCVCVFLSVREVIFNMAFEHYWYKFYACMPLSVGVTKRIFLFSSSFGTLYELSIATLEHNNHFALQFESFFFYFHLTHNKREFTNFILFQKIQSRNTIKFGILFSWANKNGWCVCVSVCLSGDGVFWVMKLAWKCWFFV